MKVFNSLILDDEETGLQATRYFLEKLPFIRIVSTANDMEEAEKDILFHQPDILFLDIIIHGQTVFELLDRLEERRLDFGVVFITGFGDEYLNTALQTCQMRYKWTYLHKPIVERKMITALNKFRRLLGDVDDRYIFHQQGKIIQIFFDEIVYCETLGNGACIYTKMKKIAVSDNLSTLEKKFPAGRFYRLSGRHLINRDALISAKRVPDQSYVAYIKPSEFGEKKLDVPREQWGKLRNAFPPSTENW